MADPEGIRKLEAILAADVAGYSRLMQADDEATVATLEAYRAVFREKIQAHRGRVVDMAGDSVLAVFEAATGAVRAAFEIQAALAERNEALPEARRMCFRIGVNLGEVIERPDGTVYGDGVNIAARLESIGEPGGVTVSGTVFDQVKNRVQIGFDFIGEQQVKNIAELVRAYRVVAEGVPISHKRPPPNSDRRNVRRILVGAGGVATVAALTGGWLWWRNHEHAPAAGNRIAVLPFTNISADGKDEYFADGMTEELISRLSQIRELDVIARTSVMQYKGKSTSVADIGRELNVQSVLEGSVRRAGDKLRITAQLVNTANQGHLWSENYDREVKDVFAIQSDIAQRIAQALKVHLGAHELGKIEKHGTENLEAHNAYLLGRHEFNKFTEEGFNRAVSYYQQAIQKDPTYALAYSGLADAYHLLGGWGYLPSGQAIPQSKMAAQKALELDSAIGDALATLAYVRAWYDRDLAGAEADFRQALQLSPNPRTLFLWGLYLEFTGRAEDSIREIKRARDLDPLSMIINANVGLAYYCARQYDTAIDEYRRVLQLDPNFVPAHWWLGLAYAQKKMNEEALSEARNGAELVKTGLWREAYLGYLSAMSGKKDEALQALQRLQQISHGQTANQFWVAFVYLGLGDKERAIQRLQVSIDEPNEVVMWLKVMPFFDPIRSDPRYILMPKKLGLEK